MARYWHNIGAILFILANNGQDSQYRASISMPILAFLNICTHKLNYAMKRKKRILSYPIQIDCIMSRSGFNLFETDCIARRSDKNIVI